MSPWIHDAASLLWSRAPLLLLAALPFLLTALITTIFALVHRAVAARRPDELPDTTERWVRNTLARQGLDEVRVGPVPPGSPGMDAFWPSSRYIALKPATCDRRDPTFWAIGAHEIGHALHARSRLWGPVFTSARGIALGLDRALTACLVALVLTGGDALLAVTLGGVVLTLLARAVVLTDEAWASLTAVRLLREDGRLTPGQTARALTSLIAALGAYVAGFLGRLAVLVLWPTVVRLAAGEGVVQATALPWPALLALAALTLPLLTRGARIAYRALNPHRLRRLSDLGPHIMAENASDLGGGLAALALVGAGLTLLPSPGRDIALALALVPALVPITAILSSLVLLPVHLLLLEVERVDRKLSLLATGFVPEDYRGPPRASGPPVLTLEMHNDHTAVRRLLDLLRAGYIPLLAVFWGEQLGRWLA